MSASITPRRRAAGFVGLWLALFVSVAPLAALAQQPAETLRVRPLPPVQYIPSRDYDTRHIALDLRFDWEREQALGTAHISFSPLAGNLRRVEFDAANMSFSSVRLASGAPLRFEADTAREKLGIMLDRAYQPDEVLTVVIAYQTNAASEKNAPGQGGLTFIKPTPDEPTRPRQIWSQGQAEWNHHWFPCFDHPNDFATTEMRATVEQPYTVISNGRLVEKRANADGTRTFHWKMEQPHATYLTSIVVGEFAVIEQSYGGVPIQSYVHPNEVEAGKVTVARVPRMMRFIEEKTGLKFPNAKYGQVFVSGFGGGMENITATTLSDQTLHDERSTLDRTQDGLLSHELAHSWFGNYVTSRSWSDIWLNEGLATYFEGLWNEHLLGQDDFLYMDVKGNQDAYYNAWRQGVRRPIVTKNYRGPDAVFDVYSYPRSGAVMHMLRKVLGDEAWWRVLKHFLRKHAHQPVETEQLRIAVEETTGQPLEWFFDQWVYQMGHPIFRVAQDYNAATQTLTLEVKQEQTIDPQNPYPQAKLFQTPVEIEIGTAAVRSRIERVMLEAKEQQTFTFKVETEPLLVNFDHGNTLIKELIFPKTQTEHIYQLANDEDMTGRLRALEQLKQRLRDGTASAENKEAVVRAIGAAVRGDKFWGVRKEAAEALMSVGGTEARVALLVAVNDVDARVRAQAIASLASSGDRSLGYVYLRALDDRSYATVRAAALALGATKDAKAYEALVRLSGQSSWRDNLRASALSGLAALGDARALELGLRYAAGGHPREVRLAAYNLLGTVGKSDARVFPILSQAFSRAVDSGSTSLSNATGQALVLLGDERALKVFAEARQKAKRPEFQFIINQFERQLQQRNSGQ